MNLTSKMAKEKKDDEEENIHDCTKQTQKCDGRLLNGLSFTCNNCGKPTFLTCIVQRDDVYELLSAIDLIKYDENDQQTKPNINDTAIKRLQKIIGVNTVFEFSCLECKKTYGTTQEMMTRLLQNYDRVSGININLQEKLDIECEKNKQLNITINENKRLIEQLTDEASKQTNGNAELNDDTYTQKMNEMQKRIEDELNKMKNNLNEMITNECNNMKNSLLQQKQNIEQTQKSTKSVTISTPASNKTSKENGHTGKKGQSSIKNYFQQPQNTQQNELNNELRPPPHMRKITNTKQNDNEMHAIYVSQFEYGTKKEAIIRHITKEGKISVGSFDVEEIETRSSDPNYIAFKITTSTKELYNDIMERWTGTEFHARKYEPKKRIETSTRNENNAYENERTPWKKTNRGSREKERKTPSYKSNRNERETPHNRYERSKRGTPKYEKETPKYRNEYVSRKYRNERYDNARKRDDSPQNKRDRYERETPRKRYERNEWTTPMKNRENTHYKYTYQPQPIIMMNHPNEPNQMQYIPGQYVYQQVPQQQNAIQTGHFLAPQNQQPQVYFQEQQHQQQQK